MTIETKEKPQFSIGQKIRVIVNDKNKTERLGTIREQVWHYKDCTYNYYLEENGKKFLNVIMRVI